MKKILAGLFWFLPLAALAQLPNEPLQLRPEALDGTELIIVAGDLDSLALTFSARFSVTGSPCVNGNCSITVTDLWQVSDEGTPLAQRRYLNLTGAGVTCTDDAGNDQTDCDITSGGGGGDVGTDVIWNVAGDLAVGTGSDTAVRLAIGAANTILHSNGTTAGWSASVTNLTLVTPALGTPSALVLTNATGLPAASLTGLGTGVGTFLATPTTANLAAAVTGETGTGAVVFATSPALVTPDLGTPSAATLTSATGLPVATGISGLGAGVATFLATPSSANFAAAITGETGTVAAVFSTAPTLIGPLTGNGATGQGYIDFLEDTDNGVNFLRLNGVASLGGNLTVNLPSVSTTLAGLDAGGQAWADGAIQIFNPSATTAGINVGAHTADPSSPNEGDIYYNSSTDKYRCYQASAWVDCISAGGGSTTVQEVLLPGDAQFLATSFPAYNKNNGTNFPVESLTYDAAADESAFWQFDAKNYASGNITCICNWYADTASTGDVIFTAAIAAITPNTDTQDVETKAFATEHSVTDTHLGTTGQRVHSLSFTISNLDSITAADVVWLRLKRDADAAGDTMAGDAMVLSLRCSYTGS